MLNRSLLIMKTYMMIVIVPLVSYFECYSPHLLQGVMWCKIPKIGSSSWANNFLDLRKRTNKQTKRSRNSQNLLPIGNVSQLVTHKQRRTNDSSSQAISTFWLGICSPLLQSRSLVTCYPNRIVTIMMTTGLEVYEKPHH